MKKELPGRFLAVAAALCLAATLRAGDDPAGCPMHSSHSQGVNARGDQKMGFDHDKTTHHFRLSPEGGSIEVAANSAEDAQSRDQIRMHLSHIAKMFSDGDFSAPMFIHDQVPPGVPVMKSLKSAIQYRFEETERGGRVVISTSNAEALKAVHEFLRFQIEEHQTGDAVEVKPAP